MLLPGVGSCPPMLPPGTETLATAPKRLPAQAKSSAARGAYLMNNVLFRKYVKAWLHTACALSIWHWHCVRRHGDTVQVVAALICIAFSGNPAASSLCCGYGYTAGSYPCKVKPCSADFNSQCWPAHPHGGLPASHPSGHTCVAPANARPSSRLPNIRQSSSRGAPSACLANTQRSEYLLKGTDF